MRRNFGSILTIAFWISVGIFTLWGIGGLAFVYWWLPNYVQGEVVTIGDYRGLSSREAERRATGEGLTIDYAATDERFDAQIPYGHIIDHTPASRQRVKKTRPLRFTVSKGPEVVYVPDLRGKTAREAEFELSLIGLRLGSEASIYADDGPRSHEIITSSPEANVGLKRGSAVDVLASLGPRPAQFPMPQLIDMTLEQAAKVIRDRQLELAPPTYQLNALADPNVILSQSPGAGTPVWTGETVRITVNERKSRTSGGERTVVIEHRVSGSRNDDVHVKVVVEDDLGRYVLTDGVFPGGEKISQPRSIFGQATLYVYENDMERTIRKEVL